MADSPLLTGASIREALARLDQKLSRLRVVGEMYVFGGAAMALAYDDRRSTHDVDALYAPDDAVREASWDVAQELELPRSWLNNQASSYLAREPDLDRTLAYSGSSLHVYTASPQRLLAMKLLAARPLRDESDIRRLAGAIGIDTPQKALEVVHTAYPDQPLPNRAHDLIQDLFGDSELK